MRLTTIRTLTALAVAGLWLAGCQSYERDPLNLDEHRQAWLDRSPASEQVLEFARRLDQQETPTDSFDPTDGVTVREGEVIALVFNPDLRMARARAQVAAATAENAGLWEDPVFQIDLLHITESVSNPWVITPGLALTIPLSGRLDAEKDRAGAALRSELYRIAEAEWELRMELRRKWALWSANRMRLRETEALHERLQTVVASTERLAEAGELLRTEAALFAIEQAQQRTEMSRLHGEIAEGEQRIRLLLGLSPAAPIELVATLTTGAQASDAADDPSARNPKLARLGEEYEVAEQTLRREILKQYPDLTIGPQYESDQGQSRIGFLGAIPLPILNANRQGIAEAEAERAVARAAYETEYERIVGALAVAQARLNALGKQREEIEQIVIPLVDRQLADTRQLLQLGEGAALVLLESLTRAHETKLQLVDLRVSEALAMADIAQLTGPDFVNSTPAAERGNEAIQ